MAFRKIDKILAVAGGGGAVTYALLKRFGIDQTIIDLVDEVLFGEGENTGIGVFLVTVVVGGVLAWVSIQNISSDNTMQLAGVWALVIGLFTIGFVSLLSEDGGII